MPDCFAFLVDTDGRRVLVREFHIEEIPGSGRARVEEVVSQFGPEVLRDDGLGGVTPPLPEAVAPPLAERVARWDALSEPKECRDLWTSLEVRGEPVERLDADDSLVDECFHPCRRIVAPLAGEVVSKLVVSEEASGGDDSWFDALVAADR